MTPTEIIAAARARVAAWAKERERYDHPIITFPIVQMLEPEVFGAFLTLLESIAFGEESSRAAGRRVLALLSTCLAPEEDR